ncbi:hypothetical protein C8R45DRAFT_837101 [Mycena sanguinolenta]|nr:hypothetical protein C8R45DRAFT_837101 [Mycena sanguinolenta]
MPPPQKAPDVDEEDDPASVKKENASYTPADQVKMMNALEARRAECGDVGHFKMPTFNEVAALLNPPAQGAPKTGKSVKNKCGTLKSLWDEVIKINNNSGWPPFDKEFGANITPERASVWKDWVAKNPKAKLFRNAGFEFYDQFNVIVPLVSAVPRGRHVYHPSESQTQNNDQDVDEDEAVQTSPPSPSASTGSQPGFFPGGESPPWDPAFLDMDFSLPLAPLPEADLALDQLSAIFGQGNVPLASPPTVVSQPDSQPDNLADGGTVSPPLTPSQPTIMRKRGPSETHLPAGRVSDKRVKPRDPPVHPSAKPASSKMGQIKEVFGKLDARMGDLLSAIQTPEPSVIRDTPNRLSTAVTLARRERVWLPNELHMRFLDLLEGDRNVVVSYLTMENEPDKEYRREWILWKLDVRKPEGYNLSQDVLFPM